MILFKKKIFFIPIREYWYEAQGGFLQSFLFSVYFKIADRNALPKLVWPFPGKSIAVELDQPEELIFSSFGKPTRNYIRQAEKLDLDISFLVQPAEFLAFYNQFARKKKLRQLTLQEFDNLQGMYRICKVQYSAQVLAMHFYILHPPSGEVQLFKSASGRFSPGELNSSFFGMASKYLHYKAMLYFRDLSFRQYDFGGFSDQDDPDYDKFLGVNQFKKNFGGKEIRYVNYASIPYHFIRLMAKLTGR